MKDPFKPRGVAARTDPEAPLYRAVAGMLALTLTLAIAVSLVPIASAGTGVAAWDSLILWVGAGVAVLVGVVLLLLVIYRGKKWVKWQRWLAFGVAGTFLIGGLLSLGVSGTPPPPPPPPTGNHVVFASVIAPTTRMGTPSDTIAEVFDSDGCTGGGPQTSPAATLWAFTTTATVDATTLRYRKVTTVTSTVATTAATFSAPDAFSLDISFQVQSQDKNGDSTLDSQGLMVRGMVSVTSAQDPNSSVRQTLAWDAACGTYFGIQQRVDTAATDGVWSSFWPGTVNPSGATPAGSWSVWRPLGQSTGADTDFFRIAGIEWNYGSFGYVTPPIGTTYTYTVQFAGTDQDPNSCPTLPNGTCQVLIDNYLTARA